MKNWFKRNWPLMVIMLVVFLTIITVTSCEKDVPVKDITPEPSHGDIKMREKAKELVYPNLDKPKM